MRFLKIARNKKRMVGTLSISHASGDTMVSSGPCGSDSCRLLIVFTAEGPIVFISVEPRVLHQQLLPLMQPTAITAVNTWRGRHCCMLTHSQKAATVAPPQDQVFPTPTILHTPQIWSCSHYAYLHSRPQLCGCSAHAHATNSDSAASPQLPVPRA